MNAPTTVFEVIIESEPSSAPRPSGAPPGPITYEIRSGRRAATRTALLLPSIRPIATAGVPPAASATASRSADAVSRS